MARQFELFEIVVKDFDGYSIEGSKRILERYFDKGSRVNEIINGIKKKLHFKLLASMLNDCVITTAGYDVEADGYQMHASQHIHDLRKLGFPIRSESRPWRSCVNKKSRGHVYFISQEDKYELFNNPDKIIDQCLKEMYIRKIKRDKKNLKRMVREHGKTEFSKMASSALQGEKYPLVSIEQPRVNDIDYAQYMKNKTEFQ